MDLSDDHVGWEKTALLHVDSEGYERIQQRLAAALKEGRGETVFEVGVCEHSDQSGASLTSRNHRFQA